jgi:hypothetical protein
MASEQRACVTSQGGARWVLWLALWSAPSGAQPLSTQPDWTVAPVAQASAKFGEWTAAGDVNGDGFDDAIITATGFSGEASGEGRAYLFLGGPAGLASSPAWTADPTDQAGARFGACAAVGDVNGDGFADVLVTADRATAEAAREGRAYLYLGGPDGLSPTPAWTADPTDQADARFGYSCAIVGDVDGDGFDDVVVGALRWSSALLAEGRAYLFRGGLAGLETSPSWTSDPADQAGALFGTTVASAGDVDGDGFTDVLIGATQFDGEVVNEGGAFLFRGGPWGLSATPDLVLHPGNQTNANFGNAVRSAGDVNADGYGDVLIGEYSWSGTANSQGRAHLYLGGAAGLSPTPAWTPADVARISAAFGNDPFGIGDVNGDGHADVVISAYGADGDVAQEGAVYLYLGTATGPGGPPAWTAHPGDQAGAVFGYPLCAGDFDGNGYPDLLVTAHGWDGDYADQGRAWVFHGGVGIPPREAGLRQAVAQNDATLPLGSPVQAEDLRLSAVLHPLIGAGGPLVLEVEVKPIAQALDGTGLVRSAEGVVGTRGVVSPGSLPTGPMHWRARVSSPRIRTSSAWYAFGGNPAGVADFVVLDPADAGWAPDGGAAQDGGAPPDDGMEPGAMPGGGAAPSPIQFAVRCGCDAAGIPAGAALLLLLGVARAARRLNASPWHPRRRRSRSASRDGDSFNSPAKQ